MNSESRRPEMYRNERLMALIITQLLWLPTQAQQLPAAQPRPAIQRDGSAVSLIQGGWHTLCAQFHSFSTAIAVEGAASLCFFKGADFDFTPISFLRVSP